MDSNLTCSPVAYKFSKWSSCGDSAPPARIFIDVRITEFPPGDVVHVVFLASSFLFSSPLPVLGKVRGIFGCFVSVSATFLRDTVSSSKGLALEHRTAWLFLKLHLCHFLVKTIRGLFSYFNFIYGTVSSRTYFIE